MKPASVLGQVWSFVVWFTKKQSKYQTIYLSILFIVLFLVIRNLSPNYLVEIPVDGGQFSEGMVGFPRFVNPVLAISQTDKDLSTLLFSGLLQETQEGEFLEDMALNWSVNEEMTRYTITLDSSQTFHDGTAITSEDVVFTYSLIQDPLVKSPLFSQLVGVEVTALDEQTVEFSLNNPKNNFLKVLTIGILPKHYWQNTLIEEFAFAEQNINPLGSGPYRVQNITSNSEQRIASYNLAAYEENQRDPYISNILVRFYAEGTDALRAFESGAVDNLANISAQELLALDRTLEDKEIQTQPTNRTFAVFYNPNSQELLSDKVVRTAIDQAINRERIVTEVFFGRSSVSDGPLPETHPYYTEVAEPIKLSQEEILDSLEEEGWKMGEDGIMEKSINDQVQALSFTLHVPDVPELVKVAERISEDVRNVGVAIQVIPVSESDFTVQIVRKRNFDMVLFGHIVSTPVQVYAFWHSSGVEDPGVNIASYQSKTTDAILERLLDPAADGEQIEKEYQNLQKQIRKDLPASFIFTPHFIYATDVRIKENDLPSISFAQERFRLVEHWYINTESILPFFRSQL